MTTTAYTIQDYIWAVKEWVKLLKEEEKDTK